MVHSTAQQYKPKPASMRHASFSNARCNTPFAQVSPMRFRIRWMTDLRASGTTMQSFAFALCCLNCSDQLYQVRHIILNSTGTENVAGFLWASGCRKEARLACCNEIVVSSSNIRRQENVWRRTRRDNDLQSSRESRRAVLNLASGPVESSRLE